MQTAPKSQLSQLLDCLNLSASMRDLETLAIKLSMVAGQDPAWSRKYVHSVYKGVIQPSKRFEHAVTTLGASLDGVPAIVANTQPVTVYAQPGLVRPNAVILAASRSCARPGCPVCFVPVVPWQRYCCPDCRPGARKDIAHANRT